MFNLNMYLSDLTVAQDDEELKRALDIIELDEIMYDDPWLSRQGHFGDEVSFDQQVDDQREFVNGLENRMRTAGIVFVTRVRAHDELSKQLDQLSYSAIKAKANSNRAARAKAA
jgi:hypothetical protein